MPRKCKSVIQRKANLEIAREALRERRSSPRASSTSQVTVSDQSEGNSEPEDVNADNELAHAAGNDRDKGIHVGVPAFPVNSGAAEKEGEKNGKSNDETKVSSMQTRFRVAVPNGSADNMSESQSGGSLGGVYLQWSIHNTSHSTGNPTSGPSDTIRQERPATAEDIEVPEV